MEKTSRSQLRKAPKQRRSRDMVANIVAATVGLLRTMDPESITTNHIAEAAGVSKGSIYQYFRVKDDIIVAAMRDTTDRLTPRLRTELSQIALLPPAEMIDSAIDLLIGFSSEHAAMIQYLAKHPDYSHEMERGSDLPMLMRTMVTMHVRQYRRHYRGGLDAENIAWMFINSAIATTMLYFESGRPMEIAQFREGLTQIARGLLTA